jgi:hypothetical protein
MEPLFGCSFRCSTITTMEIKTFPAKESFAPGAQVSKEAII